MFNILVIHPLKMYLERENRTDFLGETFIAVSLIKGCDWELCCLSQTRKRAQAEEGGRSRLVKKASLLHWPCSLACLGKSCSLVLPPCPSAAFPKGRRESRGYTEITAHFLAVSELSV